MMSYMGSTGYVMAGSGIDTCWETVCAANSVPHMMTGHAYSRALGAYMSTTASLVSDLLISTDALKVVDTSHLKRLLESARDSHDDTEVTVDEQLVAFSTHVNEMLDEAAVRSRTAKLWVQYIKLVGLLELFIFSTCSSNFILQLTCLAEMIPVCNAAGHFAYVKYTRLYLQQIGTLKLVMPEAEFKMFAQKGMFVYGR